MLCIDAVRPSVCACFTNCTAFAAALLRSAGGWELMDWGDVVVHVMTTEQREYYALEGGRPGG